MRGHEINNNQTSITQNTNYQLDKGLTPHVFNDTNMFNYIRSVKCNVEILHVRKYPAKGIGLFIIKIPKTNNIIPLWPKYYMPQICKIQSVKHH